MKAAFVLACFLLAGVALGQFPHGFPRGGGGGLPQGVPGGSTSCHVKAGLKIRVKHGHCRGWARASCAAITKSDRAIDTHATVGVGKGLCKPAVVKVSAEAIATAIAAVYTDALAKIKCNGQGFGCGFGLSTGDASAVAYAEAIRKAVAYAKSKDPKLSALCLADFEALSVTITKVVSKSLAATCVHGTGSSAVFQKNAIIGIAKAIAEVYGRAVARICDYKGLLSASKCSIDGGAKSDSKTIVKKTPPTVVKPSNKPNVVRGGFAVGRGVSKQLKSCVPGPLADCCFGTPCPGYTTSSPFSNPLSKILNGVDAHGKQFPVCICY